MHKKNIVIYSIGASMAMVVMLIIPLFSVRAHAQTINANQQLMIKTNILVLETNVVFLMQEQLNVIQKNVITLLQRQVQILQQRIDSR